MTRSSCIVCFLIALWLRVATGHVQLTSPKSQIDDDYQYTFDGTCEGPSCDAFCGIAGPSPAITTVQAGAPLNITFNANIIHPPFKYRVSLSTSSDPENPSGFDTAVLLDDVENLDERNEFSVVVDIPEDVKCEPYCMLQLYDYYYFASCSRIRVGDVGSAANAVAEEEGTPISQTQDQSTESTQNDDSSTGALETSDSEVSVNQEAVGDAIMLTMSVTLPSESWVAIGVSPDGAMVGSRAFVGLPGEAASVKEYDLNAKFIEGLKVPMNPATLSSSFDIVETNDGQYVHDLSVVLPIDGDTAFGSSSLYDMRIIWAHADPSTGIPTDTFGYHGDSKGDIGSIDCPTGDAATIEDNSDNQSDLSSEDQSVGRGSAHGSRLIASEVESSGAPTCIMPRLPILTFSGLLFLPLLVQKVIA